MPRRVVRELSASELSQKVPVGGLPRWCARTGRGEWGAREHRGDVADGTKRRSSPTQPGDPVGQAWCTSERVFGESVLKWSVRAPVEFPTDRYFSILEAPENSSTSGSFPSLADASGSAGANSRVCVCAYVASDSKVPHPELLLPVSVTCGDIALKDAA